MHLRLVASHAEATPDLNGIRLRTLRDAVETLIAWIDQSDAVRREPIDPVLACLLRRLEHRLADVVVVASALGPSLATFQKARSELLLVALEHQTCVNGVAGDLDSATSHTVTTMLALILAEVDRCPRWLREVKLDATSQHIDRLRP
jgi:hypothetical protein